MKLSSRALVPVLAAMLMVGGVVAAKTGYGKETEAKGKAPAIQTQPKSAKAVQKGHLLTFLFSWLAVRSGAVPGPLSRAPGQVEKKNSAGKAAAADKSAELGGDRKAIPSETPE